jgi:hypothetical protein
MNRRRTGARAWTWALAAASFGTFVLAILVDIPTGNLVEAALTLLLYPAAVASLLFVGALLVQRVPGNVVGSLLLAAGVLMSAAVACGLYAQVGWAQPTPWPGTVLAAVLNQVLFIYPMVITLVIVPLYFPTGTLLGPRWRWVVWLTVAVLAATTVADLVRPTTLVADIPNPLGTEALAPLADALSSFTSLTSIIGFGAAAAAIVVRFRRATGVDRQQQKWLLAVAGFAAVVLPLSFLVPNEDLANALFVLDLIAFAALPIAIGIAVLRYRLYEIDRLISRTIGWAVVTGILVAVFTGLVVGLQAILAPVTDESTLAVAASTLVAFALFQPLRRRVQRTVDRRFDRARYDGERTAAAFGERLRNEVDLAGLETDLTATVGLALRPGSTGVWIRNVRLQAPAEVS